MDMWPTVSAQLSVIFYHRIYEDCGRKGRRPRHITRTFSVKMLEMTQTLLDKKSIQLQLYSIFLTQKMCLLLLCLVTLQGPSMNSSQLRMCDTPSSQLVKNYSSHHEPMRSKGVTSLDLRH